MYSKVISHAMMGPSRPEVVRGDAVGGGPRGRGGMAWGVGGRRFGFGLGAAGWASGLGLGVGLTPHAGACPHDCARAAG